jgi:hypothetical protein
MSYKYLLENGTGMPLRYACLTTIAGVGVQYEGIIAPSSPVIRNKHGVNPSFVTLADGDTMTCRVWDASEDGAAKPPKIFTLDGNRQPHMTLQCPAPLQEECDPLEMMMGGKFIPPDRHRVAASQRPPLCRGPCF